MLEECTAEAIKRIIAFQLEQEMKKQKITKSQFAKMLNTSRAAIDRILDPYILFMIGFCKILNFPKKYFSDSG